MSRAPPAPDPSPGRLGLLDDRAADWLEYLGWTDDDAVPVLWALSRAPDPTSRWALVPARVAGVGSMRAATSAQASMWRGRWTRRSVRSAGACAAARPLGSSALDIWCRVVDTAAVVVATRRTSSPHARCRGGHPGGAADAGPEPTQSDDLRSVGTYRAGASGAAVNVLRTAYRDQVALLAARPGRHRRADEPTRRSTRSATGCRSRRRGAHGRAGRGGRDRLPGFTDAARLAVVAWAGGRAGSTHLGRRRDLWPSPPTQDPGWRGDDAYGTMAFAEVDAALRPRATPVNVPHPQHRLLQTLGKT